MLFFGKTVYNLFISGMSIALYNPFTNNVFYSPFSLSSHSTYINYKLTELQVLKLNNVLQESKSGLTLTPIKISEDDFRPSYFLSVNIYNVTSPLFVGKENTQITRCEINTYVKNENNKKGTVILDYCSNGLSIDPIHFFNIPELKTRIKFNDENKFISSLVKDMKNKIDFSLNYNYEYSNTRRFYMSNDLLSYSDNIFYKNGIFDKLFYDSSLTNAIVYSPLKYEQYFNYCDMNFSNVHSVFYFANKLNFICGLWANFVS